jgi:molecular chaperone HtpG
MQLPDSPGHLRDLDLMKLLASYGEGQATWFEDGRELGARERSACQRLYANLTNFVEASLHPLMDRVTAREMQGFTMHDRHHGLKVAHLMWHILAASRRKLLSPGEIALLVSSAHFHDLGMGLSDDERKERLNSSSSLWDTVDPDSEYSKALARLTTFAQSGTAATTITQDAIFQVQQAQEALLCLDCRERHATRSRYEQIINSLVDFHKADPSKIGDPKTALAFDGDSFEDKLIEICISHNEDAHVLLDPDPNNFDQLRFPTQYPIGCCVADTRLVAAALRLADILDFDRERTPPVLFHYLLPQSDDPRENMSVREWSKHLAISNWQIESEKITFRGRSPSAFIHHVIVEFCHTIEDEIRRTKSIYADDDWPFVLKPSVLAAIEATGYRYLPYRFSLDEQRVYDLLMGKNLYRERLDAVRELVQNAVDACKLRDSLMQSL